MSSNHLLYWLSFNDSVLNVNYHLDLLISRMTGFTSQWSLVTTIHCWQKFLYKLKSKKQSGEGSSNNFFECYAFGDPLSGELQSNDTECFHLLVMTFVMNLWSCISDGIPASILVGIYWIIQPLRVHSLRKWIPSSTTQCCLSSSTNPKYFFAISTIAASISTAVTFT